MLHSQMVYSYYVNIMFGANRGISPEVHSGRRANFLPALYGLRMGSLQSSVVVVMAYVQLAQRAIECLYYICGVFAIHK